MSKRVLIIGNPQKHPSSEAFLQKFVKIISPLSAHVKIICADTPPIFDNVTWFELKTGVNRNRFITFLRNQVEIISLLSTRKAVVRLSYPQETVVGAHAPSVSRL